MTSIAATLPARPTAPLRRLAVVRAAPAIQDAQWAPDRRAARERRLFGVAMPTSLERRQDLRRRGDRFDPAAAAPPHVAAANQFVERYLATFGALHTTTAFGQHVDTFI